ALLESIAHGVIRLDRLGRQYGISRRFLNVLKLRGSEFRDGAHDYAIRRGGIVVFPRLAGAEYRQHSVKELVRSGIAGLDSLLGGGLERGTSVLLLGPAGG